ncbi:dipeptide ABC transporter ATP-binding protein [Tessaracoccus palaemonis]|uniref:ABC transporter ATP-binding protein n=1 Tax=Tessaracoccus palaemonis TaxID=2829499 RepID=A0ABX8SIF6_9ACTN|nr:ABC transporter ATP-binding protein [Tessaracoccus palaemonis]QXT61923.1 ABC transporter ATP-binding protein [Tessaracoccus palaemonis]
MNALIELRNLNVTFETRRRTVHAVRGIDLSIGRGEVVAVVGESGSGKSVTARTLVGLTGQRASITADEFSVLGRDARTFTERQWRSVRGRHIGLVLQDALSSLDPLRTVRREVGEVIRVHRTVPRHQVGSAVIEALDSVGFPDPERRADQFPHQLSGGLRQRALIASAVAGRPELLIADEPTTALDVTVQAQILTLLRRLREEGTAILFISHDLAVVSQLADRILVMRDGSVVEQGPTAGVLAHPQHEYTRQLLRAIPSAATRGQRLGLVPDPSGPAPEHGPEHGDPVVLSATDVRQCFSLPQGGSLAAVDGASLVVRRGRKVGIVGESGSGKSTLARVLLGLQRPDAGTVLVNGRPWGADITDRRAVQFVSQDPLGSFDPRYNVGELIAEPLRGVLNAQERATRVEEVMRATHLDAELLTAMPRALSGGQRQRVSIARALALRPAVLVCDEPVSALDVSIQAEILDLLDQLVRSTGTSLVFISHDLGVVQHLVDEVLVMSHGRIVEEGEVTRVLTDPQHPYTRELLAAVPRLRVNRSAA